MNPIDYLNSQIVRVQTLIDQLRTPERHNERGNVTMEHVLWAGVIVLLVAAVAAILRAFIEAQLAPLR